MHPENKPPEDSVPPEPDVSTNCTEDVVSKPTPEDGEPKAVSTESPVTKPKRIRKKKKPKDALAPKFALSGYNFFMREVRPSVLERNPDDNIQEITKKVALEWGSLSEEQKRPYLDRAEEEKKRYAREMDEYKKMKADLEASTDKVVEEPIPAKKAKPLEENERPATNGKVNGTTNATGSHQEKTQSFNELLKKRTGDYDIPIFTDDFLEHNKALDSELRTLRKSQTDYEQQNSILEKHVDNMRNGVDKLTRETDSVKETNKILSNYLQKLRQKLVDCLSGLSIPSHPGATLENVDQYMSDLQNMVTSNSHGPASLNKAKDIIRKADLHIQTP